MINLHAPLAPSSADQWRWCAGSVRLSKGMADEETDSQREGTATHWVGEQVLHSFTSTDSSLMTSQDIIGTQAPNGVTVNEEMWDAAKMYVDDILLTANQHGLLRQIHIEEPVVMPEIHEHCWGTPDCWMFDEVNRTLYLYDFKYGHSGVVAFENWQMICYIIGILRLLTNNDPVGNYGITVEVKIIQPRCFTDGLGPIRKWAVPASDLRGYVNILNLAAHAAFDENAQCVTGPHCKNCEGAVHCRAIAGAVANAIDHSDDAIPLIMDEMGLGYELTKAKRAMELLKTRTEAMEADAEHRIRNGIELPGWSMEQKYSNAKWSQSDAAVISIGELMGVDFRVPAKAVTPTQAKEVLRKANVDPMAIQGTYAKQPSGMKLAADDGSKARMIFSK